MKRLTVLILILFSLKITVVAQPIPDSVATVKSTDVIKLESLGYIDGKFAGIKVVMKDGGYALNIFGMARSSKLSEARVVHFMIDGDHHILPVYGRSRKTSKGIYLEDTFMPVTPTMLADAATAQYVRIIMNNNFFDLTNALSNDNR